MGRISPKPTAPPRRPAPKPVTAAAQQRAEAIAAEQDTVEYVVNDCPIQHDGVLYPVGADIPLTAAQAERLGTRVSAIPALAPGQSTTAE